MVNIAAKTRKRILNCLIIISILLASTIILSSSASAEGSSAPGQLYVFNAPGFGAVSENVTPNVYQPTPGASLPERVNLSVDKYFPPIRNQIGGACVAWATTYYQFTYQAARLNNWDAKHDDSKVFSPKYIWNFYNNGTNTGVAAEKCYTALKEVGSLRWSEYPQTDLSFEWYQGQTEAQTLSTLHNALKTRLSEFNHGNFADPNQNFVSPVITSNKDGIVFR